MDFFLFNPIKSKHPDAISQNLVGIRKYAAGWFIGYKEINPISEANAKKAIVRNKLRAPFFVCRPNPENQIRKGTRM